MKKIILITILSVVSLGLIGGWFYWFQYRPLKIRKDCNWTERINGGYDEPDYSNLEYDKSGSNWFDKYEAEHKAWEAAGKPMKYKPTSSYWGKATDKEYSACLRDNGLEY